MAKPDPKPEDTCDPGKRCQAGKCINCIGSTCSSYDSKARLDSDAGLFCYETGFGDEHAAVVCFFVFDLRLRYHPCAATVGCFLLYVAYVFLRRRHQMALEAVLDAMEHPFLIMSAAHTCPHIPRSSTHSGLCAPRKRLGRCLKRSVYCSGFGSL